MGFERLELGDVAFDATASELTVTGDRLDLGSGLEIPLLGGTLGLEAPSLVDTLRTTRHLEAGVRLEAIRLEDLASALDLLPLEGSVEASFPRVRLSEKRLAVDGDGEIELLGGRVTVRDISGEEVLSRFPKLVFSAELREIDLGSLTRAFDFGEMTGTLEGRIDRCELFRWTPVRFDARLETVERRGVPRAINVKAINNIAILGTGGRIGIFDRGIHRFLDRYTYERLGIEATLEHDVFRLRGLERRGDRELFLKGRLPFRIDVVNAEPGKTVSFRAMLDRLRALDFGAASRSAPVEVE
jgi:hypothetical protein